MKLTAGAFAGWGTSVGVGAGVLVLTTALGTGVLSGSVPVDDPRLPALLEEHGIRFALENPEASVRLHWRRYPALARRHHRDPAMAPFYGAPPMALLTVGAAFRWNGFPSMSLLRTLASSFLRRASDA